MAHPGPSSPEKAMTKGSEKNSPDYSSVSSEHLQYPEYTQPGLKQSYSYSSLPAAAGAAPRYDGDYGFNSPASSDPAKNPADFHPPVRPDYNRHVSDAWQQNNVPINEHHNSAPREKKTKLEFAQGDVPKGAKTWYKILNDSIIIRWFVYIVPFTFLLWIPGIVQMTAAPTAQLLSVLLKWWSSWFTVVWVGWWASTAVAMVAPTVLRNTLGLVAPELKKYIAFLIPTQRYVTLFTWSIAIFASFQPLVYNRTTATNDTSTGDGRDLHYFSRGLLGVMISSIILLLEKVLIQVIATNFHKTSYQDRITAQKFQIRNLVAMYIHTRNIGRADTLDYQGPGHARKASANPAKVFKNVIRGVRSTAQTAATALGTIASEIAGERVLQPNSPASMVSNALSSKNKTRQLARRVYFSFVSKHEESLKVQDIARCFNSYEDAVTAFEIFDRDGNGDATMEEIEMACLDIHRERLALTNSMQDLDSAVGRLDAILVSVWYIVALLIIVALISSNFSSFLSSAGTIILGLSWMISLTAQEILASIVFLFVKHAYDIADRVDIDGEHYVVKEINLLFTIFKRLDGKIVQIPHSLLNTKAIINVRRSNAISEDFLFDVDFSTSFEKINDLRERMLAFVTEEKRDYFPVVDIAVQDYADQGKLSLAATIRYKSNWQNTSLMIQRRNKWVCMLKMVMADLKIFGPAGAGNPSPEDAPQLIKILNNQEAAPPYATGTNRPDDNNNDHNDGANLDMPPRSAISELSPQVYNFTDVIESYEEEDEDIYRERGNASTGSNTPATTPGSQYAGRTQAPPLPPLSIGVDRQPPRSEQIPLESINQRRRPPHNQRQ